MDLKKFLEILSSPEKTSLWLLSDKPFKIEEKISRIMQCQLKPRIKNIYVKLFIYILLKKGLFF